MLRTLIASVAIALAPLPALAGPEAEALIAGAAADISDPVKGEEAFTRSIDVAAVEPGVRQGIWQVEVSPGVFCVN